ncbi:ATP-binding protein [Lusitaniella coriacea LEGE 07157]|uniref:ATP-binding protein n=1 Tax=Lusitaniella coriacea LEGE 07157 TaxID=945747 RepID=A0A8J7DY71_9CYAN|nr:ATP-binding protein [Lusitaniella coriacea]MBE9117697.1 ATP-binding protein [Lusitaniella coriacea LEGE 07157]
MQNSLKTELSRLEEEQVRSNIERIISSYRHVWDIYTELLQNSADAILEQFGEENIESGFIKLEIDTSQHQLSITDNGIGILEDEMSKILVTGKSLKRQNNKGKFGFMGYGFTFVAFQSEYLRIESIKNNKKATKTYKDLYKFVYSNEDIPNSEEENNGNNQVVDVNEENGTKITLKFPVDFPNECVKEALAATFRIAEQKTLIQAVLRTRSVVGLLDSVFGSGKSFKFELYVNNKAVELPTGYLTTREIVKEVLKNDNMIYSRQDYEPIIKATETIPRNPRDQARKAILIEEKIDEVKIGERNPLTARFYIAATSKSHINTYNEKLKSTGEDYQIEHGLWLAICGMPTGICLDAFEHSNYLPYTVVVDILDKSLRNDLDAGRKGISDYRTKQIVKKAFELLKDRNFIKYRRYVVGGGDTRISDPFYDPKQELREKLEEKEFIESNLNFRYFPPVEEQEVVILFTEFIQGYFILNRSFSVSNPN